MDHLAGHVAAALSGEKCDQRGNVVRLAQALQRDLADGLISIEAAKDVYGIGEEEPCA